MKNISLIIVLLSLGGCIGVGVFYPSKNVCYAGNKYFDRSIGTNCGRKNVQSISSKIGKISTKNMFLSKNGPPDKVRFLEKNKERWSYKQEGFRWIGILPMVGLPIPIGIPVLPKYHHHYFTGNMLDKSVYKETRFFGAWCGYTGIRPVKEQTGLCTAEEL
ncbi:MAG: hypothetical protein ACJAS6_000553 [Rickettsiales bacterium]|jgi:hypothetical protein